MTKLYVAFFPNNRKLPIVVPVFETRFNREVMLVVTVILFSLLHFVPIGMLEAQS
jgi:hypothetical protein